MKTHAWERSRRGAKSGWMSPVEIDQKNDSPMGSPTKDQFMNTPRINRYSTRYNGWLIVILDAISINNSHQLTEITVMKSIAVVVVLLATSTTFAQQDRRTESPEEFCVRVTKLAFSDSDQVAELTHPDELKKFRELILATWKKIPEAQRIIVFKVLFDEFSTFEKLNAMNDVEVFASFHRKLISSRPPDQLAIMKNIVVRPLGHVTEGENVAHAVLRVSLPGTDDSALEVRTLKKFEGAWYETIKENTAARVNASIRRLFEDG